LAHISGSTLCVFLFFPGHKLSRAASDPSILLRAMASEFMSNQSNCEGRGSAEEQIVNSASGVVAHFICLSAKVSAQTRFISVAMPKEMACLEKSFIAAFSSNKKAVRSRVYKLKHSFLSDACFARPREQGFCDARAATAATLIFLLERISSSVERAHS
jgi:hypothetical protein